MSDLYADMRQIMDRLRENGGTCEIHAEDFPDMATGEYMKALYRLRLNRRIRLVSPAVWEVVQ